MDKQIILETAWNTIWNSYNKRVYVGSLSEFTGYKHYFEALTHIRTKAVEYGYKIKIGVKYISLVKGE